MGPVAPPLLLPPPQAASPAAAAIAASGAAHRVAAEIRMVLSLPAGAAPSAAPPAGNRAGRPSCCPLLDQAQLVRAGRVDVMQDERRPPDHARVRADARQRHARRRGAELAELL